MSSHFIPPFSIEKFAAYLDGNLPQDEMNDIESSIQDDDTLQLILEDAKSIDVSSLNHFDIEAEDFSDVNLDYKLEEVALPSLDSDEAAIVETFLYDQQDIEAEDDNSCEVETRCNNASGIDDNTNESPINYNHSEYYKTDGFIGGETTDVSSQHEYTYGEESSQLPDE